MPVREHFPYPSIIPIMSDSQSIADSYEVPNATKATFDECYRSPTPANYCAEMSRVGYEIGDRANPYFSAAAGELQRALGDDLPVVGLDLGCSYGIGAALLNHTVSFGQMARFFADLDAPTREACVDATREWLSGNRNQDTFDYLGLDSSPEAIRFAEDAGLIESGIARNLEDAGEQLSSEETDSVRRCNLLTSTGAIGYVGERTLSPLLENLGRSAPKAHGPYVVVTILRMFDPAQVAATFKRFGYRFEPLKGIRLRQRRFESPAERNGTLKLLEERGVITRGWESEGFQYADLFAAAPPRDFDRLKRCLLETKAALG